MRWQLGMTLSGIAGLTLVFGMAFNDGLPPWLTIVALLVAVAGLTLMFTAGHTTETQSEQIDP